MVVHSPFIIYLFLVSVKKNISKKKKTMKLCLGIHLTTFSLEEIMEVTTNDSNFDTLRVMKTPIRKKTI